MKDVSIIVELAVDDAVSDEALRSFVEGAIQNRAMHTECASVDPWCLDVVGIKDGAMVLKDLPVIGFRMIANEERQEIEGEFRSKANAQWSL